MNTTVVAANAAESPFITPAVDRTPSNGEVQGFQYSNDNDPYYLNRVVARHMPWLTDKCTMPEVALKDCYSWHSGELTLFLPLVGADHEHARSFVARHNDNGIRLSIAHIENSLGTSVPVVEIKMEARGTYHSAYELSTYLEHNGPNTRAVHNVFVGLYQLNIPDVALPTVSLAGTECMELSGTPTMTDILNFDHAVLYKVDTLATLGVPISDLRVDQALVSGAIEAFAGDSTLGSFHLRNNDKTVVLVQIPVTEYGRLKAFAVSLGMNVTGTADSSN